MTGALDPSNVSTSYMKRQNLSMRMGMRRFTRLTNAFSKVEPHIHMVALYFTQYNFAPIHKTLRCSPAMAAGISKMLWSVEDTMKLIDARAVAADAPSRLQSKNFKLRL